MEYLFYKSKHGNFGDDLNAWLWPQLFSKQVVIPDTYFLGIGSILFPENPDIDKIAGSRKIVFGTGVRPTSNYSNLKFDDLWNILFLRGPLSSYMLNGVYKHITDAAYALRLTESFPNLANTEKKYDVSLMPYFKSLNYVNWPKLCEQLGFHYISPLSENGVEFTIKEIASSKKLITEAMHGAIVADLLRVPWHRFVFTTPHTEGSKISDFKWTDWTLSVKIPHSPVTFVPFYRDTRLHEWIKNLSGNSISAQFLIKSRLREDLLVELSKDLPYTLSSDMAMSEVDAKINDELAVMRSLMVAIS